MQKPIEPACRDDRVQKPTEAASPMSSTDSAAEDAQVMDRGVLSPCVRNCCLDEGSVCMGCFRSMKEICAWHDAPEAEKLAILLRCRERYRERYATRGR